MKKWILLLTLAIIGVLSWYFFVTKKKPKDETPKQQPLAVSQHSDSFNLAINKVLSSYYALTNDFVKLICRQPILMNYRRTQQSIKLLLRS
jgi:hypothetical protein